MTGTHAPMRLEWHYADRVVHCYAERPANVDALLRRAVASHPDAPAIVQDGQTTSYAALDRLVDAVASNLAASGLVPGDRVGTLLANSLPAVVVPLACARAGLVVVPMNPRQRAPEIAHMLADSGAAALVHDAALAGNLPDLDAPSIPRSRRFTVGGPVDGVVAGAGEWCGLEAAAPPLTVDVPEDEPFCLLYTSGTTGRPKGAILTHLGVVHSCINYQAAFGLQPGDRSVLAVPASHVTGLVGVILATIAVAGCMVLMAEFKAARFLELAATERVTFTILVPAMYNLCLLSPAIHAHDLSAWRVGAFGGAPMPQGTIDGLLGALPGLTLANIYGSTETTSPAVIMPLGAIRTHPDCVGVALGGMDIRVMDETGREVPPGAPGELWIAGPSVVPGYWNDPANSKAAFIQGYWRSGDIGSVAADGFVRIFDRKKDVVNRGGYKIYAAEVESVLSQMPGIIEAAVVSRPCPVLGERVEAFVVGDTAALTAEAVRTFCARHLSDYKVPEWVTLREAALPRNSNGKLMKSELRAPPAAAMP